MKRIKYKLIKLLCCGLEMLFDGIVLFCFLGDFWVVLYYMGNRMIVRLRFFGVFFGFLKFFLVKVYFFKVLNIYIVNRFFSNFF